MHGTEGWWDALRRRKVAQWGILYVAGAWSFLQGFEFLSDTYGWPLQLQQLATLALLIGLPIVLVVAWYHGDRGQHRAGTEPAAGQSCRVHGGARPQECSAHPKKQA